MCGALKRARLVKVGVAEVVFVRKEDAVSAYRKYNNRCLDGECQEQGRTHESLLFNMQFNGCCSSKIFCEHVIYYICSVVKTC